MQACTRTFNEKKKKTLVDEKANLYKSLFHSQIHDTVDEKEFKKIIKAMASYIW